MNLYAILILTLVCLSTTFAECPDKCVCRNETSLVEGLQSIYVACEDLQHIPLQVITSNVFRLVLHFLNITVLSNIDEKVKNITQLIILHLSNNHISNIEVNSLRVFNSLEFLDLADNNITSIPSKLFKTLPKLQRLLLSINPHLILPENGFGTKELVQLDMDDCNLMAIPPKFFDTMPNIKRLGLQGNHISYLGSRVITAFQKMIHVSLILNNFTVFEPDLISLLTGRDVVIHLAGNRFRCDCPFRVASHLKQFERMSCVSRYEDTDFHRLTVVLPEIPSIQDCEEAAKSEATIVATNTSTSIGGSDVYLHKY